MSLENLSDLAEFGHLGPDTWVRRGQETEPVRLADQPELFRTLFPEKKQFRFTSYQGESTDAGRPAVGVDAFLTCSEIEPADDSNAANAATTEEIIAAANSAKLRMQPQPKVFQETDRETGKTDVSALLQESVEIAKRRAAERQVETPVEKEPGKRVRQFFTVTRWVIALFLIGVGASIWISAGLAEFTFSTAIEFFVGLVIIGAGVLVICVDLAGIAQKPFDWFLDLCLDGRQNSLRPPPDYATARNFADSGDSRRALAAYKKLLYHNPRELGAYLEAIRLARQVGNAAAVTTFHQLALKNLPPGQDRNLFLASEKRLFQSPDPEPDGHRQTS